jgi:ectoine hydroxylase-related dioxygenase (phytanoyl-CoA dioxygenase family)
MRTAEVSAYRRNGFVVIPAVLDEPTIAACVEHLRHLQVRQHSVGPIVTAPLATDRFLASVAADSRLSAIAGLLLQADPIPFGCTYIVKEPRSGLPVLWHQDGYPWRTRFGISEAISLWIALDRAGEGNGGLRVIPGSHALAAQPLRPSPTEPSVFGCEIDGALVDATLAQPLTLAPGDVAAHHPSLIHGSPANRSEQPRRALAIRYRPGRSLGLPPDE